MTQCTEAAQCQNRNYCCNTANITDTSDVTHVNDWSTAIAARCMYKGLDGYTVQLKDGEATYNVEILEDCRREETSYFDRYMCMFFGSNCD